MLKISGLSVSYGKVEAITSVNTEVPAGSIVSIIGANGAGKSTLLKAISAIVKYSGTIEFQGKTLSTKPHRVVESGIVHVPEGRKVFVGLTVLENLYIGGFLEKSNKALHASAERMFEMFPVLKERRKQHAGTLSGGEQQMLAIARGLMANPKLLLLDEPSLGLAPLIAEEVFCTIKTVKDNGITVMLVEQNASKSLQLADYAYVLENGKIAKQGKGIELLHDPEIIRLYLGS